MGDFPTKTREHIRYQFSREEKELLAVDLAQKLSEIREQESRRKEVIKSLDAGIAATEAAISSLAVKVKDGYEYRDIDCSIEYDWESRIKRIVRSDTFEIVREAPISDSEMQLNLEDAAL